MVEPSRVKGDNRGNTLCLLLGLADHPPSVLWRSLVFSGGAKLHVGERSRVILLVLVAVLWVVVLAPSVLRRIRERGGVGSVDHFHHQLELLEHAGPKLVTPAYRLQSAGSGRSAAPSSRPKLVLLRAVQDAQAADIEDVDGAHYARVGVIQRPDPPLSPAQTDAELAAYRRQQARQRCTFVLRVLVGAAITTGILGALPALRLAWIFTGIAGIGALALAGLIAYAREVEGQRRQSRPRPLDSRQWDDATPEVTTFDDDGSDVVRGAAQAGFPGAWDEVEDEGIDYADYADYAEYQPQRRTAIGG